MDAIFHGVHYTELASVRIADLPKSERPAARARNIGFHALTKSELLTLALSATNTETADTLMLTTAGSLRRMGTIGNDALNDVPGLNDAKILALGAIFELGRRYSAETLEEKPHVGSPRDVVAIMAPRREDLPVEELHVLILNAQHRLERDVTLTRGLLNSSLVHPREVFREAITERAAAIIVVHNHPSGDPTPSADDRNITDQLVAAGRLLDIPLHDHIIIGRGRYTSFAETGLL